MFIMSAPECKKSSSSTGVIINERKAKELWETREREKEVGGRSSETQKSYRNEYDRTHSSRAVQTWDWRKNETGSRREILKYQPNFVG